MNQPFAHGDLKPDNILVRDDGSLVLVDYDGMYVPAMQGQKALLDMMTIHWQLHNCDVNRAGNNRRV